MTAGNLHERKFSKFCYAMSIIIITALVSLFIAIFFLGGLIWSVKDGQYEDDYSPANRILFDNETSTKTSKK